MMRPTFWQAMAIALAISLPFLFYANFARGEIPNKEIEFACRGLEPPESRFSKEETPTDLQSLLVSLRGKWTSGHCTIVLIEKIIPNQKGKLNIWATLVTRGTAGVQTPETVNGGLATMNDTTLQFKGEEKDETTSCRALTLHLMFKNNRVSGQGSCGTAGKKGFHEIRFEETQI